MDQSAEINGINVSKMLEFKKMCGADPAAADHNPTLIGHWIGGSRSRVEFSPGASTDQLAYLKERYERSSPVADTFTRAIPVKLEFTAA